MPLQLTDNNWVLKIDTNYDGSDGQEIDLGLFASPYIIVRVSSASVLPGWRKGGFIGSRITTPQVTAYGARQELSLIEPVLIEFPIFQGSDYRLFYFPLFRLATVHLEVWEYAGETIDTTAQELLTALQTQAEITASLSPGNLQLINDITTKLDIIMGLYTENANAQSASTTATAAIVAVTNTAGTLVAANPDRKGLVIKNVGDKKLWIGFTNAVTKDSNFLFIDKGVAYSFDLKYTGEIFAISETDGTSVRVTQFT